MNYTRVHPLVYAALLLAVVALGAGYCWAAQRPGPGGAATATPAPDDWTAAADAIELAAPAPASCQARGPLPDPVCTPGATDPSVTQATIGATICIPGYTQTVRPPVAYTNRVKRERLAAYGMPPEASATTELDHLVPLALGGNPRSVLNLWPEAAEPVPGFHQKDAIERAAQLATCAGTLSLADAQRQIATDWTQLQYLTNGHVVSLDALDPDGEP